MSEIAPTKLPPERHEHLDAAVAHRVQRVDGVEPVGSRRIERELPSERVEERLGHALRDAHRAIALHVGVPADRRGAGSGLADVAAQQQQVHDLLDRVDGLALLGESHRPRDDHAVGGHVAGGQIVEVVDREAGGREHLGLVERREVLGEGLEAHGVLAQERVVEHGAGRSGLGIEHALRDGLQERHVAARTDLQVPIGDLGASTDEPTCLLRVPVADEPGLGQRVDRDDAATVALGLLEGGEHARMIGAGVLAHDDDEIGSAEIVVGDRGLADADDLVERGPRGLMAHVRAVGEVVGAVCAHEQLVEERRLVRRSAAV